MYIPDFILTDEDFVIPFGTGDEFALKSMWKKVSEMNDRRLMLTWVALKHYSPCDYYDSAGKIGMDTWASAVDSEIASRHISRRRKRLLTARPVSVPIRKVRVITNSFRARIVQAS